MARLIIGLLAALNLLATSLALPAHASAWETCSTPSNGVCTEYTITESVTATELIYALPKFENNFDVASFLTASARKDSATAVTPLAGAKNVTNEYTVSATFCTPKVKKGGKESTVLIATHGLGYDRRYWASAYKPDEYSFAASVLESGYSILFYDRIGVGQSQLVSGFENQESNQVAFLAKLAQAVKAGTYTSHVKASKVVLVGHSFGSTTSHGVLVAHPDLVDGAILTGIAYAAPNDKATQTGPWIISAFAARIASTLSDIYSHLDTGYVGFGDIYAHTETFFHVPFDIDVIKYAQSISQPFAITEYLTVGMAIKPTSFKGKVLLAAGEYDLVFCGGECKSTYEGGGQKQLFKDAEVLETYLHPGAGHGLNFAVNAKAYHSRVVEFLDKNF